MPALLISLVLGKEWVNGIMLGYCSGLLGLGFKVKGDSVETPKP